MYLINLYLLLRSRSMQGKWETRGVVNAHPTKDQFLKDSLPVWRSKPIPFHRFVPYSFGIFVNTHLLWKGMVSSRALLRSWSVRVQI